MWVYIKSASGLWTVGYYDPRGSWHPISDHGTEQEAGDKVHCLNGGWPIIRDADGNIIEEVIIK